MNRNLLKSFLVVNNINVKELAKEIGISSNTLYSKINGNSEFNRNEIMQIKDILHLTAEQVDNVFFN
jgi:DNA-binding Xre family transcriptional regulator